jgi:serine/threonine-protein kinase
MLTGDVPFHGENHVTVAMRHVREELPDLQMRRPGISSALAAVVDRATDKDLSRRYATAEQMIAELEDALAIEGARSGHTGAEATAVLRTLPPQSRKRLPLRDRVPRAAAVLALLFAAAAVVAVVLLAADNTQRGTGPSVVAAPKASGVEAVSLRRKSAHDYDPFGSDGEHPEQTSFAVDRDPNTAWPTENYRDGFQPPKTGVGLYIDAAPTVAATRMEIQTPTSGWQGDVYVARTSVPDTLPDPGWKRVAAIEASKNKLSVKLATDGESFRYYLIWITKLPKEGNVKLAEVDLLKRKR